MTPDRFDVVTAVITGQLDTNHTNPAELQEYLEMVMEAVQTKKNGISNVTPQLH